MLVRSSGIDPLNYIIAIATGQNVLVVSVIGLKSRALSGVRKENVVRNVSDNRRSLLQDSIQRIDH